MPCWCINRSRWWVYSLMLHLVVPDLTLPTVPTHFLPRYTSERAAHPNANILPRRSFDGDSLLWPSFCRTDVVRCSCTWKWSRCLWSLSPAHPHCIGQNSVRAGLRNVWGGRGLMSVFGDWEIKGIVRLHFYSRHHSLTNSHILNPENDCAKQIKETIGALKLLSSINCNVSRQ